MDVSAINSSSLQRMSVSIGLCKLSCGPLHFESAKYLVYMTLISNSAGVILVAINHKKFARRSFTEKNRAYVYYWLRIKTFQLLFTFGHIKVLSAKLALQLFLNITRINSVHWSTTVVSDNSFSNYRFRLILGFSFWISFICGTFWNFHIVQWCFG